MRNIIEYPITTDEKTAAIEWATSQALADEGVGDITAYALQFVARDIRDGAVRASEISRSHTDADDAATHTVTRLRAEQVGDAIRQRPS